eukprot:4542731-Amphidinium_carterae.1
MFCLDCIRLRVTNCKYFETCEPPVLEAGGTKHFVKYYLSKRPGKESVALIPSGLRTLKLPVRIHAKRHHSLEDYQSSQPNDPPNSSNEYRSAVGHVRRCYPMNSHQETHCSKAYTPCFCNFDPQKLLQQYSNYDITGISQQHFVGKLEMRE